ncbi:hypothetical protein [Nocardia sp. NPDC050710]|uniref:hypothetical protein n=1 Tax=Nocardia sp. NPDC050710 TaxID=3157220 RepID=UPI0033C647CA
MSDNNTDPILPIPSDLDDQVWQVQEKLQDLRRMTLELGRRYRELGQSPESLRTDNLGKPISPATATKFTQIWLSDADTTLERAQEQLHHARTFSSRLSLTDQADQHREQQLARQRGERRRTR